MTMECGGYGAVCSLLNDDQLSAASSSRAGLHAGMAERVSGLP